CAPGTRPAPDRRTSRWPNATWSSSAATTCPPTGRPPRPCHRPRRTTPTETGRALSQLRPAAAASPPTVREGGRHPPAPPGRVTGGEGPPPAGGDGGGAPGVGSHDAAVPEVRVGRAGVGLAGVGGTRPVPVKVRVHVGQPPAVLVGDPGEDVVEPGDQRGGR